MNSEETRILSIDFGMKRIGLALSDPLKIFAYPFKTIINDSKYFEELVKIIKENKVDKIILGIPDADNQSTNDLKKKILLLKEKIEKRNIEVILWDETFTSLIADQRIIQSIAKKSKRREKGLLDRHSAAVILQEFLDSRTAG